MSVRMSLLAVFIAAGTVSADAATLSAFISTEQTVTVDTATDGLAAVATNSGGVINLASDTIRYAESKATAGSLHSYSISGGWGGGPVHPRFQGAASIVIDDLVFTASPGITGPFAVTLSTTIDGTFNPVRNAAGYDYAIGAGYVIGTMSIGNLTDPLGNQIYAGQTGEIRFESGLDGSVLGASSFSDVLSQSFLVLPDSTRRISLTLRTEANGGVQNGVVYGVAADASNSLRFNPAKVFDLPEGVTVNSASWGLVDNQLPYLLPPDNGAQVPLPAALPLLLAGFGSLMAFRRRNGPVVGPIGDAPTRGC